MDVVRSLSTVPARSTSRVSAGVLAGAAVAGFAAYESTSPTLWAKLSSEYRRGVELTNSHEVPFDDGRP
jgi:hypothetical protein